MHSSSSPSVITRYAGKPDAEGHEACGGTIAYGITPQAGGTTTFYRNFAAGMRAKGWTVWGVSAGRKAAEAADSAFGDGFITILTPETESLEDRVRAFLRWVEEHNVDIVIPMCQDCMHAAIRHLPSCVGVCVRVATITRGGYVLASAHRWRASRVLVVSPRQRHDLVRHWQLPASLIRVIPNGLSLSRFVHVRPRRRDPNSMIIGYLGRLEDQDKGVLLLPDIFARVACRASEVRMLVFGDGPSRVGLLRRLNRQGLNGRVRLPGRVEPHEVPSALGNLDVFLMPSRFEGFPNALVEAMAAGCVPVASHIRGVTDFIIKDGISGFLCPVGDTRAFAETILRLDRDRDLLARMSAAARKRVEEHFSLERMIDGYDRVFREVLAEPPPDVKPASLTGIRLPPLLKPTWRTRVPQPVKNFVRKWMERLWGYAG